MDDRLRREQEFHDHSFATGGRARARKFYTAAEGARRHYEELVRARGDEADVLECGCGPGGAARLLRSSAESIVAIDISEVAIEMAREWAASSAGSAEVRFEQMNAEAMSFPDESFDLVCGSGILHHLSIPAAVAEVHRVLKPGGSAVFFEPLGHNPLIEWYRRRTPGMRSPDEHPLRMSDLESIAGAFTEARFRFFSLTELAVVPFRRWAWSRWLTRAAAAFDRLLFRLVPYVRRFAWIVVIEVRR